MNVVTWYVQNGNDDPIGPISTEAVVEEIKAGRIPATANIAEVGASHYVPLSSVEAFVKAITAVCPPPPPPPPPSRSFTEDARLWYVRVTNDAVSGPSTSAQVAALLEAGSLTEEALVCEVGASEWIRAEAAQLWNGAAAPKPVQVESADKPPSVTGQVGSAPTPVQEKPAAVRQATTKKSAKTKWIALFGFALLALVLVIAGIARALTKDLAEPGFQRGQALVKEGKLDAALAEFDEAAILATDSHYGLLAAQEGKRIRTCVTTRRAGNGDVVACKDIPSEGHPQQNGAKNTPISAKPIASGPSEVLVRGLVEPSSLVVTKGKVFVTVFGKPASKQDTAGTIVSLPQDGGEITIIARGQKFPYQIQSDESSLFWVGLDQNLWQLSLDGGAPRTLYHASYGMLHLVGLDEKEVYFSIAKIGADGGEGGIYAVPKSGGGTRPIYEHLAFYTSALNSSSVFTCQGVLGYLPKRGNSEGVILERGTIGCNAVAADSTRVFWSHKAIKSREFAKAGGKATMLVDEAPVDIVLDGEHVYWPYKVAGDWRIRRVNKLGGSAPELVADKLGEVTEIFVAKPHVYWTNRNAGTVSRALLP